MSGLLQGRVAIVTGAGRGIGRAIAESLIAEGAQVIVADNGASIAGDGGDPEVARAAVGELNEKAGSGHALAFTESVASPGVGKQLVDLALKTFGGIDIVVNNAAILRDAFVFRADPADWDAVIRTNLSAAFYLINAASGVMREQGKSGRGGNGGYDWGRIVNIVSSAGLYGNLGQAAYASAKAGQIGLTRQLAHELGPWGITVNAVAPGFVRSNPATERQWDAMGAAGQAALVDGIALKRLGTPDDIAAAVMFFASAKSGWITGQVLSVDGGK